MSDGGRDAPEWDCENCPTCPTCDGTGKDYTQNQDGHPEICDTCGGNGWVCGDTGEPSSAESCQDCMTDAAAEYQAARMEAYS